MSMQRTVSRNISKFQGKFFRGSRKPSICRLVAGLMRAHLGGPRGATFAEQHYLGDERKRYDPAQQAMLSVHGKRYCNDREQVFGGNSGQFAADGTLARKAA